MEIIKAEGMNSNGIAIGLAYKLEKRKIEARADKIRIDDIQNEIVFFNCALDKTKKQLEELSIESEILSGHLSIINDHSLSEHIINKIKDNLDNAEQALVQVIAEYVSMFEQMEDVYLRERSVDIEDIGMRLLCTLKGINGNEEYLLPDGCILAAESLIPSDMMKLELNKVAGILTEEGGITSHVAIMANSSHIPFLIGGEGIMDKIKSGQHIGIDVGEGLIFLDPDDDTCRRLREKAAHNSRCTVTGTEKKVKPLIVDGKHIKICANVGNIGDIKNACKYSIDGIGLFRSEFLYMEKNHFPTEQEQFLAYKTAAELCEEKEVTIRTLDIGGDKTLRYFKFPKGENPYLGYRSIRISLDLQEVFMAQLRALLRAGEYGNIRIMYPMIISAEEFEKANELLEQCKRQLRWEKVSFCDSMKVGMMVETPAAVINIEQFSKMADFLSIGTNDLTQYMLAVDRGNQKVSQLYDCFHPAVLRSIQNIIMAGHKYGKTVCMCGEMAGDIKASELLYGMGLDEFSMSAVKAEQVRKYMTQVDKKNAGKLAEDILNMDYAAHIHNRLEKIT